MEPVPSASRLQFGDAVLVPVERQLLKHGQLISLTPKAFDLLVVLAENPGRLLTKDQLMEAVWGNTAVEESNLAYHISAIRKALGDTADNGHLIETVPKRGYRFTAAVTPLHGGYGEASTARDLPKRQPNVVGPVDDLGAAPSPHAGTAGRGVSLQPVRTRDGWRSAVWIAAGISIGVAVGAVLTRGGWTRGGANQSFGVIRAQISPGVRLSDASPFSLSPDGRQLVYVGKGPDGRTRLWVRRVEDEAPRPLAGTETALSDGTPPMFWSPDSQSVGFDAAGQLKRVDVRDGTVRTICALTELAVGGSWNDDGLVIVGHPNGGLSQCSVADGRVAELTLLDTANGETAHVLPWFLPDGRHFLYVRVARSVPEGSGVYVGSLDDGPAAAKSKRLLATGFGAQYVPASGSSAGHLIFLRDGTLFAQPFDERLLQIHGDPVSLAGPVGSFLDAGFFSVSLTDVIAFRPPNKDVQLTWVDRQGRKIASASEIGRYSEVAISPDGSRIASAKETAGANIDKDIFILGASRATMRRVTFGPLLEAQPVWSGDGRRIIFTIGGDVGTLFEQGVDTAVPPRLLLETKQHKIPTSASRDGKFLLYTVENISQSRADVWVLPLAPPAKPFPLIQRNFDQEQAQFSPDGRWVSYVSNESGISEVLLQRFVALSDDPSRDAQTVAVSAGGGTAPRWRADGGELYFLGPDDSVMAVDVQERATMVVGTAACALPHCRLTSRLGCLAGRFPIYHRDPARHRVVPSFHPLVEPSASARGDSQTSLNRVRLARDQRAASHVGWRVQQPDGTQRDDPSQRTNSQGHVARVPPHDRRVHGSMRRHSRRSGNGRRAAHGSGRLCLTRNTVHVASIEVTDVLR